MSTPALNNIEVKADCGQVGTIHQGESEVLVLTDYSIGKRKCDGCVFQCSNDGVRATLSSPNNQRVCLEYPAPVAR